MSQKTADHPSTSEFKPPTITAQTASLGAGVWKRFRKHPGAIFGFIVLLLLVILVVFAPLSPYDPEASKISERYQAPSLSHPMARMRWGAIYSPAFFMADASH